MQLLRDGYRQRRVADALSVSKNTVTKVIRAAAAHSISCNRLHSMEEVEIHRLLFPEKSMIPALVTPDFPYIHKELLKSGVTLKLLWEEYADNCRRAGSPPYMYSQYCKLYQNYVDRNKLTMHKPGDKLVVDWAGTTLPLYDRINGKVAMYKYFGGVTRLSTPTI